MQVLAYVDDETKVSMRNRLIFHLLLYTAVRVSELVSIKVSDIDFIESTLIVRGKGGKVREIVIREDLMARIQHYIEQERSTSKFHDSPFLLVSQRSEKCRKGMVMVGKSLCRGRNQVTPPPFQKNMGHTVASKRCANCNSFLDSGASFGRHDLENVYSNITKR